jgi:hypothetical protein
MRRRSLQQSLTNSRATYIQIKDAAACSHLSSEYLARLARSGRIRAHLIGRMLCVELPLQQFLSMRGGITKSVSLVAYLDESALL